MDDQDGRTIPFGYTWSAHESDQPQDPSHPPSGPPLLDNNETGYLRTFFDNPDHAIEPNFLGMPHDRISNGGDVYSPNHTMNWMVNNNFDYPNPPGQPHDLRNYPQPTSAHDPMAFGFPPANPSDDVYAAARLLQGSQDPPSNGHMDASAYMSQRPNQPTVQLTIPPPLEFHTQPNAFDPLTYPNRMVDPGRAGRNGHAATSDMAGGFSNESVEAAKRRSFLNFGSDNKFKQNSYAAPRGSKPPDQDLHDIMVQHISQDSDSGTRAKKHSSTPNAAQRKRRRGSAPADESESGDDDADSTSAGRKKRKSIDAADRSKGTKRLSKGAAAPKSPPQSSKNLRENLTEEQKRSNHIQSEQKRRNLIKLGFEDTNRMVPELRAGGFSKSNMLLEAAKFMRELQEGNAQLKALIEQLDKG